METPCAEDTAYLCAVKSLIPNSFFVHVSVLHFLNLSFNSLLDCGSSHCFLDKHFSCSNYFPITPISLTKLWLLDGSLAGNITHASTISIKFPCGTLLQIQFLLTKFSTLHSPIKSGRTPADYWRTTARIPLILKKSGLPCKFDL